MGKIVKKLPKTARFEENTHMQVAIFKSEKAEYYRFENVIIKMREL